MAAHRAYRALTHLYPKDFRQRYRDDLVQHHADLRCSGGAVRAWTCTGLDLLITVPRYRLEAIMNPKHSNIVLSTVIGLMAVAGVASFLTGLGPGILLLPIAIVLAVTQRSQIARAIRTPNSDRRRHLLRVAASLAVVSAITLAVAMADVPNDYSWGLKVILYNIVFFSAAIGAIATLVIGLLTPKSPSNPAPDGDLRTPLLR